MHDVVQLTGPAGARAAGAVLGPAFVDDPVWSWLVRGQDRQARLTAAFTAFASTATRTPGARVLATAERSAVAVWLPPGQPRERPLDLLRTAPAMAAALRGGVLRGLRLQSAVESVHPQAPHWYLEALGALPEARGTGVGGRVLQPVLDRCDADGLPAYLESSNPRNWSFYARHGFAALDPVPVPPGCPLMLPMLRPPR